MPMDEKQFTNNLARKLQMKESDISKLIEAFVETMKNECGELKSVSIPSFGRFTGVKTLEYIKTETTNGKPERVLYPPMVELQFTASNVLKTKLLRSK